MAATFNNPLCQQAHDSTHNLNVDAWYPRRARLYRALAKANGLQWTKRGFALEVLAHGGSTSHPFDGHKFPGTWWPHRAFFTRERRPALFLVEPYDSFDQIEEVATRLGLVVQSPPNPFASFWFPTSTRCMALTRLDFGPVRWLPEQLSFYAHRYSDLPRMARMAISRPAVAAGR